MNRAYQLSQLQAWVEALAEQINAPADLLPTYGRSEDFARPHLEVNSNGLHFVVVERGREFERRTTQELDELLYWVFQSVTFSMAGNYEVKHRIPDQDVRRLLFQRQVELLAQLNEQWAARCEQHLASILEEYPFDDTR